MGEERGLIKVSLLYTAIPEKFLSGFILDVGCGNCTSQLQSKNANHFLKASQQGRYLGIDKAPSGVLHVVTKDIFDMVISPIYDLVLLIEVAEHISFDRWPELFKRLKTLLVENGRLIVSVPYLEPFNSGMTDPNSDCPHVVFGIDEKLIHRFLPNALISYYGKRKLTIGNFKQLLNFGIHIMRRNKHVNPYKPIWLVATWTKGCK